MTLIFLNDLISIELKLKGPCRYPNLAILASAGIEVKHVGHMFLFKFY